MKKNFMVLLVLAVLGSMAFARGGQESKDEIAVILMALDSDWWHMVEVGAKIAGSETGYKVTVIGPSAETDVQGQMNMVEDTAARGVKAIVLAPNQPTSLVPSVQKAKDLKVPVVIIDAKLTTTDESLFACFFGTGNYNAGRIAGDYLVKKLNAGDKVAIIRGNTGQTLHDERTNGAKDVFEAAGMRVVSIQPADSKRDLAVNVSENILQANPDLKCIYCTNDEMALGAYQAVENAQKQDQITIMGFDGAFGALDSIAAGQLTASLAQMPIELGYWGVKRAIDVIEGRPVEKYYDNEVTVVDKNNVANFRAELDRKISQIK
ncbi:MAG: sugar ABC transporter substrate-binding protein [Prevotella sp.]|jgi:ribose transport system substrate-binding protein|nr:sugar ABC transporter substrate-binding protein [Prevotella sp.]